MRLKWRNLIGRSREEFIRHNKTRYGLPLAIWLACEVWEFGALSTLYAGLKEEDQDEIYACYGWGNHGARRIQKRWAWLAETDNKKPPSS